MITSGNGVAAATRCNAQDVGNDLLSFRKIRSGAASALLSETMIIRGIVVET